MRNIKSGTFIPLMAAILATQMAVAAESDTEKKAIAQLEAKIQKSNQVWNKQDLKTLDKLISDDIWIAWDADMFGRPASWSTKREVLKFFETNFNELKKSGATTNFTSLQVDCHASGDLGVCTQLGQYKFIMKDMPALTFQSRETEVFRKVKGEWKWVHHHGSVAKAPDMPKTFMAIDSDSAKWADAPGKPGIKMAVIWMNPVTQSSAALMAVGDDGMTEALHTHPFAMTYTVLKGSTTTTNAQGDEQQFGPGTVIYRAANEEHKTYIKPGTTLFVVSDGPMITNFVEKQPETK